MADYQDESATSGAKTTRPAPPSRPDAEVLEEMLERYTYGTNEWREIRKEGAEDIRYCAGIVFTEKERKLREDAGRPIVVFDELSQYVNQLINDIRQNKRGIKVSPQGNGATDKTAAFRQSLIRQIEYRSNAQTSAYATMFENTAQRSYGFMRVKAQYRSPESFNQELLLEAFANPDLVTPDPDGVMPDGSDIGWAFAEEFRTPKQFKRDFPDATKHSFTADDAKAAPSWISDDLERIRIAEYWDIEQVRRKSLLIKPEYAAALVLAATARPKLAEAQAQALQIGKPVQVFVDELKHGAEGVRSEWVLASRWVDDPYVCQYLTNGIELLAKKGEEKRNPWPGRSIPFIACYGKVMYVDEGPGSERMMLSMIRLARDPAKLVSYYRTCEAELVGQTPRTSYVGYVGQFRDQEAEWTKANHEPVAFLQAHAFTEETGQQVLPLPVKADYSPPIQALEAGAESARRGVQAAIGQSPLPTSAQRRNDKSGVALKQIEDSAQKGSYHFIDHYEASITRAGALIDELIPYYYDAADDVTIRKPDDTPEVVRINDPSAKDPVFATYGDHDVTISVGPAIASEREAASDFADQLVAAPQIAGVIGPQKATKLLSLAVRLKNLGALGDEMAEVISPDESEGQQPDPAEMQAAIQQLQQQLQAAVEEIKTEQAKQQAQIEIANIDAAKDVKIAELEAANRLEIAQLGTASKVADSHAKTVAAGSKILAEAEENEKKRRHELGMAAVGQEHSRESGAADHERALEQADQSAALSSAAEKDKAA